MVLTDCKPRHRHQEFLGFLKRIDDAVPADLDVHLMAERWFGLITQRAIRRGSFKNVKELISRINQFVQHYNTKSKPFAWTATADSVLHKLARLCQRISGTEH